MFSCIAVLPHSPGVVYYHLLLRRETRIPGVAPFSFGIGIWDLFVHRGQKSYTPTAFGKLWTTPGLTEIVIKIKQLGLYSGRMALNPFIASNRRYMVFPLRDHFIIENGLLDKIIRQMLKKSSKYIVNKCSQ